MNSLLQFFASSYRRVTVWLHLLENPLLLFIRAYWGWQFAEAGWGKLTHLDHATSFFESLNLPAPHLTALFVGLVEFGGGILFALGIGSRLVSFLLFCTMTVAYLTADHDAFFSIFSDPDKFTAAAPYNLWFAAILILVIGPGKWAVDTLLERFWPGAKKA
jgi:putative oxidoreductase